MIDFSYATWRKSTKTQQSGQCVEVARVGEVVGVRDSKDPDGPVLVFRKGDFASFLNGAAKGEFGDLL
ncbi:DUF397 domain-containing protein [Plantactinospora sp. KLBMP9567]|uniref:DUF397 domain-containing protein n=1 Tax=Plantactinospora sp. KLBMP9567 TaxID=3085900 RepID=UPI0029816175|nr:DUF397 domain-containing protein [Plantactinospora sp. KLBMP9567]MDW5325352.1 DUF397 domain-containing protein [Plantactinospora sp. KLBMP9567]